MAKGERDKSGRYLPGHTPSPLAGTRPNETWKQTLIRLGEELQRIDIGSKSVKAVKDSGSVGNKGSTGEIDSSLLISVREDICRMAYKMAKKGDFKFIELLLDRIEGKPSVSIEVSRPETALESLTDEQIADLLARAKEIKSIDNKVNS